MLFILKGGKYGRFPIKYIDYKIDKDGRLVSIK